MKAVISTLEEVDESLRGEYEKGDDGRFHVKLEGSPKGFVSGVEHDGIKRKVVEFRDTNIELLKDIAGLAGVQEASNIEPLKIKLAAMSNIDPKEHAKLSAKIKELEAGNENQPDVADIVKTQVGLAVAPLQEKVDKAEKREADAILRANRALLRESIGTVAAKNGARPDALSYILDQSEHSFEVTEDKVVAKSGIFSEKDPSKSLEIEEWMTGAVKKYAFAFEASKGGDPPTKEGSRLTVRDGVTILKNPTPQELGQHSRDIAQGKVQILNTE